MLKGLNNLLIDFDGTLIDSAPGVIQSLQAMQRELGVEAGQPEELRWAIGPGIQQVCRRLFPDKDESFVLEAVKVFRRLYDGEGFLQTTLYPDVVALLGELKSRGFKLYLTTMKGRPGVDKLLPHLRLEPYFEKVVALNPYGPLRFKYELIGEAMREENLDRAETAIIGDTYHDIEAGKKNGIYTIGITWGFGAEQEMRDAGADTICHSVAEVEAFLVKVKGAD